MNGGKTTQALLSAAAVAVALAVAGGPAGAQVGAFGWSPNIQRLSADDWRKLWESADALNNTPSPQLGQSRAWSNSQSGNSGTVTLQRVFRSNGMPCHALRYSIAGATDQAPQIYNFTWCRTETGEWKILG